MTNPKVEIDLGEILQEIKGDQKEILKKISDLAVELTEVKGGIKTLDEKLSGQITTLDTKVEQLDKRIANQEFINRSVLIGLILAFVGSVVSMFSNA
ncbi:hypothetical protein Xen7305DRAFT_00012460 [Xenococcus sp. PCC 7305]|uniref:hypothetical protein n=1 Tax=Xenococcus sp. PCC 7305 TaxID=102125 RepID=UPI0002ACCCAD|nr:hypothetical protein [Xenococcus sp. PCC 7305]ELS01542.1 hypothetical protein Xen7305DRAFT_00012460 [Xenococcus sp. PCC 7305]